MMNWLYYLLEANLYIAIFYGFYRLFLQHETFYTLNRWFILLATGLSFILPFIQLGILKTPVNTVAINTLHESTFPEPTILITAQAKNDLFAFFTVQNTIIALYLLMVIALGIRLVLNIFGILKLAYKAKKHSVKGFTLMELPNEVTAFSFFNLLFIHPRLLQKPAVLKHEMVHIQQWHSLDIMVFEFIQVLCWFNPLIYFLKKDLKLQHEYIADAITTHSDIQKHEYALLLIQHSLGSEAVPLRNQFFNPSILKRRINMLNKKRTAVRARLRLLLTVPLIGGMVCMSTRAFTKDYGYLDLLPQKEKAQVNTQQPPPPPQRAVQQKKELPPPPPIERQEKVKFPRVFKPTNQKSISVPYFTDAKTGKLVRRSKAYFLINGKPVADPDRFYGVYNTTSIMFLNVEEATKRYGNAGAFGAVEVTGTDIKYYDKPVPQPRQVKFPPPVIKPDVTSFFPKFEVKDNKEVVITDTRYIVINGTPVTDNSKFQGVTNSERVIILTPAEATAKYGEQGKNGAVEISGKAVKPAELVVPPPPMMPPPPPKAKKTKFPPPVIKPDKKTDLQLLEG